MESFALYRMPFQKECSCVRMSADGPCKMSAVADIDGTPGFVIAPFSADDSTPIILIKSDKTDIFSAETAICASFQCELDAICRGNTAGDNDVSPDRNDYSRDFEAFHSSLADGSFAKLVLSRKMTVPTDEQVSPVALFAEACRRYPRCFIALFSTPLSGTWLVATPELLLEKDGDACHTMALAGTMEYAGEPDPKWSTKNIREQRYVAEYIRDAVSTFADKVTADGPHTVRAAGLVHLRTDFSFHLTTGCRIGAILDALHPTPAVCGLPADAARRFILDNEHSARAYYSGFCGPVEAGGRVNLFVTLRCMRIRRNACDLFAGGGLLADSTERSEWEETEAKMKTMLNLLEK